MKHAWNTLKHPWSISESPLKHSEVLLKNLWRIPDTSLKYSWRISKESLKHPWSIPEESLKHPEVLPKNLWRIPKASLEHPSRIPEESLKNPWSIAEVWRKWRSVRASSTKLDWIVYSPLTHPTPVNLSTHHMWQPLNPYMVVHMWLWLRRRRCSFPVELWLERLRAYGGAWQRRRNQV